MPAWTPSSSSRPWPRQVDSSFNLISVDGDSSTNDSAVLLANGAAGGQVIDDRHPGAPAFEAALGGLCVALAKEVVRDGEGATRVIEVRVQGAASRDDARAIARAVTLSPLVKTAVFGADPNWGRVICAAGNAGVPVRAGARQPLSRRPLPLSRRYGPSHRQGRGRDAAP